MQTVKKISTSELFKFIPHRPPMVWIDEVLTFGPDGGECLLNLKDDAHYMTDGKLRSSSLIEFIAQAHAFISICNVTTTNQNAKPLTKAFLVSITDTNFEELEEFPEIEIEKKLFIRTGTPRQLGAITVFTGSVWTTKDNKVCTANIKVYTN